MSGQKPSSSKFANIFGLATKVHDQAVNLGLVKAQVPTKPAVNADLHSAYDLLITSDDLRLATRQLFFDGHFAEAVEEAYKALNNLVKEKSGLKSKDGADLMHHAFSEVKPILKMNALKTISDKDEQMGYKFLYAGCMTGVRNPRAHGHNLHDEPSTALELLVTANHLIKRLDRTKRVRRR